MAKKILIVDDEVSNIKLLKQILQQEYQIIVAKSGSKALELARQNPPDLILLDIQMPEMDGYHVCQRLKADSDTQAIPVIFVTTRSELEDECKGFDVGGVDYITKPISPPIALRRVRNHITMMEMEQKRSIANERNRIMRDMHDGIGGQLISALAMASNEDYSRKDIETTLHHALTDLRLIIDSMDSTCEDIDSVLAVFRSRIEQQLAIHQITSHWQVGDIEQEVLLNADKRLQLVRILQEIVNNIIKHSGTSEMYVQTNMLTLHTKGAENQGMCIKITDKGRGFNIENHQRGRGIGNMQQRAKKLGAELTITSNDKGTQITIIIPLSETEVL